MRIQHNIMAMNAYRNYSNNTSALSKNLEKLSSGYKINRAGDDAAGLAISEKMRAQITGLEGAQSNAKDSISLVQTAEGALTEVHDMLNRMYDLAEQSANGTYADKVDRENLQREINALSEEINRIADTANFNDIYLFRGGDAADAGADVEATLDATNAAALKSASWAFDTGASDEVKKAFNEAMDGKAISVDFTDEGDTNVGDGDAVKLTGVQGLLDAGYTVTFKDASSKDAAVTEGGTINIKTGASDGELADSVDGITLTIKDKDGNAVGTLDVKFADDGDAATGATAVNFAAPADDAGAAGAATVEAATVEKGGAGKDNLGNVSLAFADDATDAQRTALNEALAKASITVTTKDTGGDITVDANDTIKVDGLMAGYTYQFVAADGSEAAYTDGTELTYAAASTGTANNTIDADDDLALNIYDADGKKVATLTVGAPTALATSSTEATTLTFTAPAAEDNAADTAGGSIKPIKTTEAGGGSTIKLQIGADGSERNMLTVDIGGVNMKDLGLETVDITTGDNARAALQGIKDAINLVSGIRGDLGATQNRLEHTINNLSVMQENIQDAESTIRDTDIADEMMEYTKNNILIQSAQAMLAQANQVPQGVLQLLQ